MTPATTAAAAAAGGGGSKNIDVNPRQARHCRGGTTGALEGRF